MIFISHTEKDQASAAALAEFLAESIKVPMESIRSTCDLSGSELGVSSRSSKEAIGRCSVLLALIPPESLRSSWVMFELGAAWAMDKLLFLFFMPGIDFRDIPEPLSSYPSVDIEHEHAHITIMDMVGDVAEFLGLPEKKSGNILPLLERLIGTMRMVSDEHDIEDDYATLRCEPTTEPISINLIEQVKPIGTDDVLMPSGQEYYDICYSFDVTLQGGTRIDNIRARVAWDDIFKSIAPHLNCPQSDSYLQKLILELCKEKNPVFGENCDFGVYKGIAMAPESYKQIIRRFTGLGYMEPARAPHSIFEARPGKTCWKITPKGEDFLRNILVTRKSLQKWVYKQKHVPRSVHRKTDPRSKRYD